MFFRERLSFAGRQKQLKGFLMLKKRGLLSYIFLSLITVGIYGLWRIYVLARDLNTMCEGDGKKTAGLIKLILLGLITLGIYDIVWIYKLADRIQANGPKYNVVIKDSSGTILLWIILGSLIGIGPIVAWYKIFKNTNILIEEYNKKIPA